MNSYREQEKIDPQKILSYFSSLPKQKTEFFKKVEKYFLENQEEFAEFSVDFSKVWRWGDLDNRVRFKESDMEHVIGMCEIWVEIRDKFPELLEKLDEEKIILMIILHDIGEINKKGDLPAAIKHKKSNKELKIKYERMERYTSSVILNKITDEDVKIILKNIAQEYENKENLEAKMVKLIDIMQAYRKYAIGVYENFDKKIDKNTAFKNIKDVQIKFLIKNGIFKINEDFPFLSEYVKNDFESVLDKHISFFATKKIERLKDLFQKKYLKSIS